MANTYTAIFKASYNYGFFQIEEGKRSEIYREDIENDLIHIKTIQDSDGKEVKFYETEEHRRETNPKKQFNEFREALKFSKNLKSRTKEVLPKIKHPRHEAYKSLKKNTNNILLNLKNEILRDIKKALKISEEIKTEPTTEKEVKNGKV